MFNVTSVCSVLFTNCFSKIASRLDYHVLQLSSENTYYRWEEFSHPVQSLEVSSSFWRNKRTNKRSVRAERNVSQSKSAIAPCYTLVYRFVSRCIENQAYCLFQISAIFARDNQNTFVCCPLSRFPPARQRNLIISSLIPNIPEFHLVVHFRKVACSVIRQFPSTF